MQPQPRAYLASLRREMQSLTAALDPAAAGGLNYCIDQMVSQLIARDEAMGALTATLENSLLDAATAAGINLAVPSSASPTERRTEMLKALEQAWRALPLGSAQRKALEIESSRADDVFRKQFSEISARIARELKEAPSPAGWDLTIKRIEAALPSLLPRWEGARVALLKPLAGLHAKEIYFLDLTLASGEIESLVLRCDREADLTRASVADEFPLLSALYARGFAIPEPLVVIKDKAILGQPALIMRRVDGVEKALDALKQPERTIADAARFLARLHTTPIEGTGFVDAAKAGGTADMWLRRIARQFDWWQDMATEPAPVMWRARRWLDDNVHLVANAATVVHGDFSLRNLLLGEDDGISSVLDWELANVGHPAEDLGYMRLTVESIMPWETFDAMYRAAGGGAVTLEQIAYFDVWGLYRNLAINATVQNFFLNGKTNDYFLGTAAITYYPGLLTQLTEALEGVD